MKAIHLTTQQFKQQVYNYEENPNSFKYEGSLPAIVDFYATWCGPCKTLGPILDELAAEYDGKVLIYKVNVEEEEGLSAHFGIRSIPTMLFIPTNGTPQMAQGAMPKSTLTKVIEEVLLNNK